MTPPPGGASDAPRWVVFDAMGVLYAAGDDVAAVLRPYLNQLGCRLDRAQIHPLYRQASLGQLSSQQFWEACGVPGDDAVYCLGHQLTPGMDALLADLVDAGVPLGCLSNDVSEWSARLRARFGLDRLVSTWVISGDIGRRKPDPGAFAALVTACGTPASDLVFFDDQPANVEAARQYGIDAEVFTGVADCRAALVRRGLLVGALGDQTGMTAQRE